MLVWHRGRPIVCRQVVQRGSRVLSLCSERESARQDFPHRKPDGEGKFALVLHLQSKVTDELTTFGVPRAIAKSRNPSVLRWDRAEKKAGVKKKERERERERREWEKGWGFIAVEKLRIEHDNTDTAGTYSSCLLYSVPFYISADRSFWIRAVSLREE